MKISKRKLILVVLLITFLVLVFVPNKTTYEVSGKVEETKTVELRPELKSICTCESGQGTGEPQHYNIETGEVLRGYINDQDIGMCQINLFYHGDTAKELDIDVFTPEGNIEYANMLYESQGSTPWDWSKHCWDK